MEAPPSYNEAMGDIPPKSGSGGHYQHPPSAGFVVPPPVSPAHAVTVTQTVYVPPPALGPKPTTFTCPTCHKQIMTSTETQASTKTHLFALVLCIIGCWPCCLVPYCIDSCMTVRHSCPSCGVFLGNYSE